MTAQKVNCRELKPCPFCGGSPAIAAEGEFGQWPIVFCGNCNAQTDVELSESEAIAAWQARAQDSRCWELVEAAKIFGALLQPLHDKHKDHHPIYGINSVTITAGDLRRLTKAIAAFESSHEK